jgi:threonine dehydrogenase-like Zn-dependent dehydrogenase
MKAIRYNEPRNFRYRALRFIEQGRVTVDKIVSDELPLSEYGKALDGFRERRTVKTMLVPTA